MIVHSSPIDCARDAPVIARCDGLEVAGEPLPTVIGVARTLRRRLIGPLAWSVVVHAALLGVLSLLEGGSRRPLHDWSNEIRGVLAAPVRPIATGARTPASDPADAVPSQPAEAARTTPAARSEALPSPVEGGDPAVSEGPVAPAAPDEAIDSIGKYRLAFAFALQRSLRTGDRDTGSAAARLRVVVRVVLDASGALQQVTVSRSSGSPGLDARALAFVRDGYAGFPLPVGLRGSPIAFDVTFEASAGKSGDAVGENATT